jgi:hypothetical protein
MDDLEEGGAAATGCGSSPRPDLNSALRQVVLHMPGVEVEVADVLGRVVRGVQPGPNVVTVHGRAGRPAQDLNQLPVREGGDNRESGARPTADIEV